MSEQHWNHRVFKVKDGDDDYFQIREVYYEADGSIYACSSDSVGVCGESIEGLRETLNWMLRCLDKPVLTEDNINSEG